MPFSISNPHTWNTIVWRVKPEVKTIRYSVCLVRDIYGKTHVTTSHVYNPDMETLVKVIEQKEIEYEVE